MTDPEVFVLSAHETVDACVRWLLDHREEAQFLRGGTYEISVAFQPYEDTVVTVVAVRSKTNREHLS